MLSDALHQHIDDLRVGDTWLMFRTYRDVAAGTNVTKLYFYLKLNESDPDANAKASAMITQSAASAGQITANGSSGKVQGNWKVSHTQTILLDPSTTYVYAIKVITNGEPVTIESGTLKPLPRLIEATT